MTKPRSRNPLAATVGSVRWLSPTMVRLTAVGGDLATFQASAYTDSYVKVMFLNPAASYQRPIDVEAIRASHEPADWPRLRTYTVRGWDPDQLTPALDFVVHGSHGVAGPWAAGVAVGDEILLLGPGGGYAPDPQADWHLLVGDESALPAIATALEALPAGARAVVFIEVDGAAGELPLESAAHCAVTWVHRGDQPVGDALVAAVAAAEFPIGTVHAFVHGEAGLVKRLRVLLKVDRGIPADQLSISGYWRLGSDDEGWRAAKAEWNRDAEQDEAAAAQR